MRSGGRSAMGGRSAKGKDELGEAVAISGGVVDGGDLGVAQVEGDHRLERGEEVDAVVAVPADGREKVERVSDP